MKKIIAVLVLALTLAASPLTAKDTKFFILQNSFDQSNVNITGGSISGVTYSLATKTDAYTLTTADMFIIAATNGSDYTITTMPAATACSESGGLTHCQHFHIKRTGTDTIGIDGYGSETIDDSADAQLTLQYDAISIVSDGTSWHIY